MNLQKLDLYSLPLVPLLGGLLTDLIHHFTDGESLNDLLFGTEEIFNLQHILLPIGLAALLGLFVINHSLPQLKN